MNPNRVVFDAGPACAFFQVVQPFVSLKIVSFRFGQGPLNCRPLYPVASLASLHASAIAAALVCAVTTLGSGPSLVFFYPHPVNVL
jgi:hypothetical protein